MPPKRKAVPAKQQQVDDSQPKEENTNGVSIEIMDNVSANGKVKTKRGRKPKVSQKESEPKPDQKENAENASDEETVGQEEPPTKLKRKGRAKKITESEQRTIEKSPVEENSAEAEAKKQKKSKKVVEDEQPTGSKRTRQPRVPQLNYEENVENVDEESTNQRIETKLKTKGRGKKATIGEQATTEEAIVEENDSTESKKKKKGKKVVESKQPAEDKLKIEKSTSMEPKKRGRKAVKKEQNPTEQPELVGQAATQSKNGTSDKDVDTITM